MTHPTPSPSADSDAPTPRSRATLGDVCWLAVAGAVMAALGHVAYTEVRFRLLHVFTWTNREFAWLSLAGYLVFFLAAAVPVAALALVLRRWMTVRVAATIFVSLACVALLLLYQRIHPLAQLALGIGVGSQVAAWLTRDLARGRRFVRRLAVGGALALGALGLAASARHRFGQASRLAALREAPAGAPSVVLLIMDTVRAASMSLYGYARPTPPVLDAMAREAVVFDRAFSVAPWTAPSHASMMTGHWASHAGADYLNPMYDSLPTLAERLRERGYASGGFMANAGYAGYQLGISRGFTFYHDYPFTLRQALWSTTLAQTGSGRLLLEGVQEGKRWKVRNALTRPDLRTITVRKSQPQTAAEIANLFFGWRDGIGRRPYFAMLNFMDAHAPYDPPNGFRNRFNEGKKEIDRYDGGIAYEDSVIGTIVARLRERGDLDNTVLIVVADHGEQWGEHDLESHGNSLYLPLLHVPLLVRAPGRAPAGVRIPQEVSLRDLAATILDLTGGGDATIPGVSLARAWTTPSTTTSPVFAEASEAVNPSKKNLTRFGPIKSTLDSAWHYIRYGNGSEALFAWRSDSAEVHDLAASTEGQAAIVERRALIARLLGTGWPPPRSRQH